MAYFYFPTSEEEFENITAFSPLDTFFWLDKPFGDISAEEYLQFAKKDLKIGDKASLINALSNAKRCLHYQVDHLLYRYNLNKFAERFRFPEKLGLLSELQIIQKTLLSIYNKERNKVEHEYVVPEKETVESAIDLCELLLLATERFIKNTPLRIRVKFKDDPRDLIILLKPGTNIIKLFEVFGTKLEKEKNGSFYRENIFDLNTGKLKSNIKVKRLKDEDIKITKENKCKWIKILKIFSVTAKMSLNSANVSGLLIYHFIPRQKIRNYIDNIFLED